MKRAMSRRAGRPQNPDAGSSHPLVVGLVTWLWPEVCLVTAVSCPVFLVAGTALLDVRIPMLMVTGKAATIAYSSDKLAIAGILGLVWNPIYSGSNFFDIPGSSFRFAPGHCS